MFQLLWTKTSVTWQRRALCMHPPKQVTSNIWDLCPYILCAQSGIFEIIVLITNTVNILFLCEHLWQFLFSGDTSNASFQWRYAPSVEEDDIQIAPQYQGIYSTVYSIQYFILENVVTVIMGIFLTFPTYIYIITSFDYLFLINFYNVCLTLYFPESSTSVYLPSSLKTPSKARRVGLSRRHRVPSLHKQVKPNAH